MIHVFITLLQTVFEKIWIFDTSVAGCDLTDAFAELLTLEVRLALTEPDGETTYYRRRATILSHSHLGDAWERPGDCATTGPIGCR